MNSPPLRLLVFFCAVIVGGSGCGSDGSSTEVVSVREEVPPLHASVDDYPEATVRLTPQEGSALEVPVKVADTDERRRHGLMEVPEVPEGTGMLFVYDEQRRGGFWMKGTLTPLSIAFANAEGTIVDILEMTPCEADPCPIYRPDQPYQRALEVRLGWFGEVGIDEGDRLEVV